MYRQGDFAFLKLFYFSSVSFDLLCVVRCFLSLSQFPTLLHASSIPLTDVTMIRFLYKQHKKRQARKDELETEKPHIVNGANGASNGATNGDTSTVLEPNEVKHSSVGEPEDPTPALSKAAKKEEKSKARKYRWRLIAGLFLPFFIASTDITIIATALPFIASHFNRINQLNWIVTAFTITSTSFIPVWGQLADLFGRHAVLQTVMVLMMIGAGLAGGAQAWVMLLFGRAIMGVAAAGILNIIKIILADNVSLADNAKNNTVFALVGGISYGVGPVIGGYLTSASWRWCFILNVPVALLSMFTIFILLRHELVGPAPSKSSTRMGTFFSRVKTIDLGGLVLFVSGVTLIILGTTWGGSTYAWKSVEVIVPIVLGGFLFAAFFIYEYLLEPGKVLNRIFPTQEPMIPVKLFHKRDVPLQAWIAFSSGAAMYSIFYFVGIYFTVVKGYEASKAGIQLLYYLPGIGVGTYLAMFSCNVFPRKTWPPLFLGSVLETVGFAVLAWALHTERVPVIAGMMALAGAGTGLRMMPNTLHVAGIWPNQIARAMSVIDFCLPFGGTIAIAMMGAVFNNKLVGAIPGGKNVKINQHDANSLNSIDTLPGPILAQFRHTANKAIVLAYVAVIPIIALAIVACLFLGNVNITETRDRTDTGHLETKDAVETRPFLLAILGVSSPAALTGRKT